MAQLKTDGSNSLQLKRDGLQPNSNGNCLHPKSDGLQPKNDGLQLKSDGLQPNSNAMASSLRAMASNLRAMASNQEAGEHILTVSAKPGYLAETKLGLQT